MKTASPPDARWRWMGGRLARSPVALWSAFILTHLWLGVLALNAPGLPLGDVTIVYKYWAELAVDGGYIVGIDGPWVYPVVALIPMLLALAFGLTFYASTWLTLVMALDAAAFVLLIGWGMRVRDVASRRHLLGWWWVAFLLLLGPIALGRIDSITVPLAVIAVVLIATRPVVAGAVLAVAAWIKVWPAAVILAVLVALRSARRQVLAAGVVCSVVIVVIALILGSGLNVFSFVGQQTSRGLQIEAPVSTVWLWQALAGAPGTYLYYDQALMTYQVTGSGVGPVSGLMMPLMGLVVIAILLIAGLALRAGAGEAEVLAPLALALVAALIAFNKVGSPQFMCWLAVPVLLGLAVRARGQGVSFRMPAALALVLAALTQSFYPYLYGYLLSLNPWALLALTARNALTLVLLAWAVAALLRLARIRGTDREPVAVPLGRE